MSTILMVELSKYIIPLKFEKNGVLSVDYLPRSVHTPRQGEIVSNVWDGVVKGTKPSAKEVRSGGPDRGSWTLRTPFFRHF